MSGPETSQIDLLFLELSQFTKATTGKEIELKKQLAAQKEVIEKLIKALKVSDFTIRKHGEDGWSYGQKALELNGEALAFAKEKLT